MLIRTRLHQFMNRVYLTNNGLWVPDQDRHDVVPRGNNVVAMVTPHGYRQSRLISARNLVTNDGDTFYAQQAANETPTNDFNLFELASAGVQGKTSDRDDFTIIAGTAKAEAAGYPQTNDGDANNTGAGVDVNSHKVAYVAADGTFNNISHGIITVTGATTGSPILTGWDFGSVFNKLGTEALDVFVNHTFTGV